MSFTMIQDMYVSCGDWFQNGTACGAFSDLEGTESSLKLIYGMWSELFCEAQFYLP